MAGRGDTEMSGESSNPFEFKDELSDLVLVVEGKKLYVHRMYLALCSSMFKRILYEGVEETELQEIELLGKKYTDIVELLLQIYPGHSLRNILHLSEDSLATILSLAHEYQVEHVLQKYQAHIRDQLPSVCGPVDKLLFHLCLCDTYHFQKETEALKDMAARRPQLLDRSQRYKHVDSQLKRDISDITERYREENRKREEEIRRRRERETRERIEKQQREMKEHEQERRLARERRRPLNRLKNKLGCNVN